MGFDSIGYFLEEDSAVAFAYTNWENVYEEEVEDGDESMAENEDASCPFCQATENCDHLLLVVDITFRTAGGGLLFEAFDSKWSDLSTDQSDNEDFDESGVFEELLEEV